MGVYIVLAHEGVSERGDTWALGPSLCTQAGRKFRAPEVPGRFRPGSGLSRELARSGLVWTPGAGGSGQAGGSGGQKFRAEAGSSGLSRSLSLLLLPSPVPCLALVLGSSMVVAVVPECMQGPCMR